MIPLGTIIHLWTSWGIELLVLVNFVFQVILTYNGSRRRHKQGWMLRFSVWFAYLLAGKVASIVLFKLMTIDMGHTERNTDAHVQALLAPLMLIQIGNPDTITAYSIEDNQLGVRQVFSMVIQVAIMFYILIRSWTDSKISFLYLPLSLAGIIKYGETTWALKSALKDNVNFTFNNFLNYTGSIEWSNRLEQGENEVPEASLIFRAYYRFCSLRPHLENWLYYPPIYCDSKRLYIEDCDYEEVFKITDSELGFMYDTLYTKAPVIYTRKGFVLRLISLFSLIATLCGYSVLFKYAFVYDIRVGFIHFLLIASLILEVYQILRLPFTDWAIVLMKKHCRTCPILRSLLQYVAPRSATWRRWSNTMRQFNFLDFCLTTEHWFTGTIRIPRCWGLSMKLLKQASIKHIKVHPKVKELVVKELRELYKIKKQGEFTERGKRTIERYRKELKLKLIKQLEMTVHERTFGQSIIIWHIITDIFYHIPRYRDDTEGSKMDALTKLSNYMMYLFHSRSHVQLTTTGQCIFEMLREDILKFVTKGCLTKGEICNELLGLKNGGTYPAEEGPQEMESPEEDQFTESKAVKVFLGYRDLLKDVKELAQSLSSLSNEKRWNLIGSMWVEMLGYAASNYEVEYHLEHIRKGGELISHVWLLVAHNVDKLEKLFT